MFQIATLPHDRELKTDGMIIFFSRRFVKKRQKTYADLPPYLWEELDRFFAFKDFKGDYKEITVYYPQKLKTVKRILFIGFGDLDTLSSHTIRELGYLIAGQQKKLSMRRVHVVLCNLHVCDDYVIRSLTEGILYGNYRFDEYKSKKDEKEWKGKYIFTCNKTGYTPRFRKVLLDTVNTVQGVETARNLANKPSNHLTPRLLADFTKQHFSNFASIETEIWDRKKLEEHKFNALLSVAKGSREEPRFIQIKYTPRKKSNKKLALVGKGVTFDSGGISIKPSAKMDEMKFDMSGAAAVIGCMQAAALLKPDYEIAGFIPVVENMPGGNAVKPGDIVTAYNGKTIEILNTDAEGRLILADALAYAAETYKPGLMIDFATLTGSVVVALGNRIAGLFTKSDKAAKILTEAANNTDEYLWRMPVHDFYSKEIESKVADVKNIGSRWGGSITAAKFLEEFTSNIPWVHIDIAGTAYNVSDVDYWPNGATGFGVRLISYAFKRLEKIL